MLETAHTQDLYHHYQTAHCLRAEMFRAVFAWILHPIRKEKRAARMAQPDLLPCGC